MKTTCAKNLLLATVLAMGQTSHSQGFVNPDFEDAAIIITGGPGNINANSAIPGWAANFGSGYPAGDIYYNGVSLGGAIVALEDANASNGAPLPIQGNYSIFLEGSTFGTPTTASIGQTGTIPIGKQSLTFYLGNAFVGLQVTFNGQPISYLVTGSTANYNIYAGDISAYAGQTGQLLFSTPANTAALLDNIQFTSSPVPEPSTFALTALGGLLLGFRRWRK